MKKTIIAVLCAAMLLGLTGCGNANSTSSAQSGTQQSQSEEVEYFSEKHDMVKPMAGMKYMYKKDDIYYYSVSGDEIKAEAATQLYLGQLEYKCGFEIEKNKDGLYNIYDDGEKFAILGLARDGSSYVLAIGFY